MKEKPFFSTDTGRLPHTRPPRSNQSNRRRGRTLFITSLALLVVLIIVLSWVAFQLYAGKLSTQNASSPHLTPTKQTDAPTSTVINAAPVPQVTPPRRDSTMAYDPLHHVVLLFGGTTTEAADAQQTNETWAWNGHGWKQLHPESSPPALQGTMVYDAASQRVILFLYQVQSAGKVANEMWSWDGTTWQQLYPATMPAVIGASMAYDEARHEIVLFGGGVPSMRTVTMVNTTWTWDGMNWHQQYPATSPSPRSGAAMTYDAAHQQIILYGGTGDGSGVSSVASETWTWDGTTWQQRQGTGVPFQDQNVRLIYDSVIRQTLLFGATNSDATWTWNGNTWVSVATHGAPTAPYLSASTYDDAAQSVIVYAAQGNSKTGATPVPQTWIWNGTAWKLQP
ncbi:kelch repeat-containing protein [Dictyobacter formicarum]|uniref:kelch repeat-containing protein n=1 Tax=Dictyobacter formicarum TaxID=2778368 RepID=UPI00191625CF|nr:kelch repeat-containing protein [Dictyobacter formicarum]